MWRKKCLCKSLTHWVVQTEYSIPLAGALTHTATFKHQSINQSHTIVGMLKCYDLGVTEENQQ